MLIKPNDRILFTGDSITDCGRNRANPRHLGYGYVAFVAARLQAYLASPDLHIFNRGLSGNRAPDLLKRIESDLLALKPTIVSILIGINDTWRRYGDPPCPTTAQAFEEYYQATLDKIRRQIDVRVVLLEPFVLHVPEDRAGWREDLDPKIDVVRKLAVEFNADLIPLDTLFSKAATQTHPGFWANDGVHPTPAGHALIAEAWIENADLA